MYFLNNDVSVSSKTGVLTEHLSFSLAQQGEVAELCPIGELPEQSANCGGGDNGHGIMAVAISSLRTANVYLLLFQLMRLPL